MQKYVLTTIVAALLSCSLLLAEDITTQDDQSAMQMACTKVNCKDIEKKATNAAAKSKAKAEKANEKGDAQLAELCTACANAHQNVADAAKEVTDCMEACKADRNAANTPEMQKQCEQVCGKLTEAQEQAKQAEKALYDYKKDNKKKNNKCSTMTETPS